MIAPSLDYIPEDKSSLKTFGKMLDKLWRNLALTFAPFFLAAASYIPVISASVGTFTLASVTGRYYQLGRIVFVQITITITTNGTAAGAVLATLPFVSTSATGVVYFLMGRGLSSVKTINGGIAASSSTVAIVNYDGTYPGASGETLVISGFYETS